MKALIGVRSRWGASRSRRGAAIIGTGAAIALVLAGCSSSSHSTAAASTSAAATSAAVAASSAAGAPSTVASAVSSGSAAPAASSLGTSGEHGSVVIADLSPFTGADASLGPGYLAGCFAATHVINANGGVNGKSIKCTVFDTRGDPADAVPAARQMFASTPNLMMVIGPTSDEASAVVPIINAAKTVVFSGTGQSEFDQSTFSYFFRLTPPDIATAYALIAAAHFKYHYTRVALAFGNDIGSQTFVQPAEQAIKKLGMTLADNESINLTATSYRTEVSKIVASHPDVILTEALGPADAILLSEVKQLNGGKMIPVLGTSATIDPNWYSAVAAAVGAQTLQDNFAAATLGIDHSGPAFDTFQAAVVAEQANIKNYTKYLTHPQTLHFYDAVTLAALAAVKAKSNVSSVYAPFIKPIANGVPGATVVTSFAQGVTLLNQGKDIRYIGPGGPTNFDQYNNSNVSFQLDKYGPDGSTVFLGPIAATDIAAAAAAG